MDLVLTDDQRLIRDQALQLFAGDAAAAAMRRAAESGGGFDAALWTKVARELGWCALAIAPEYGGLGLGLTERVLLMEAAGRKLSAIPLWSTACAAAPLIATVGDEAAKARLLPAIAAGELAVAVAWGDPGACDPLRAAPFAARRSGSGFLLSGGGLVVDAAAADIVLVPATMDGRLALFALDREALGAVEAVETLDATRPMALIDLRDALLPAGSRLDADGFWQLDIRPVVATASLCLAAEDIGAAQGAMDLTLAYISERVQFGRTIASFQAVKHRCALLETALAEARALTYGAAANAGDAQHGLEVDAARALAADVLFRAAEECIQLHGGVGFTWDYDAHFYLKRAQASAVMLGAPSARLARIADALLGEEIS